MPSPTENVFSLLKQKKYEEIIPLIQSDANLVNAINPENGKSLLQLLVKTKATDESNRLLQFVLTHPKINFQYENTELELTNIDEMVSSIKLDAFQTAIKNPQILFNRNLLTYDSAKEYLVLIQNALKKDMQKDPNSEATARTRARIETQEAIIALLRDATILHAISTDDVRLMDRLEQSGAKPADRLGKLGNEKLPKDLLTAANPNLRAWFKARFEQTTTRIATNPHSFLNGANKVDQLQAQLAQLEVNHLQARAAANGRRIEKEMDFSDRAIATLSS